MITEQLTTAQMFAAWALPVLFGVTLHEVAHGYIANLFGDKTAKILGRLTINPLKHIDLIGTIIVPGLLLLLGTGFIIGWAKPVPINPLNLHHPKRDMAFIALAGPMANVLMAIFWAFVAKAGLLLSAHAIPVAPAIFQMGNAGIQINLVLAVLNLLPIPPLDGGHVLMGILPRAISNKMAKIAPFGFFILLFLLAVGILGLIVGPVVIALYGLIANLFGF